MNLRLGLLYGDWRRSLFLLATASLLVLSAAIGELQSIHGESEWRIIAFFLLLPIGLAVTFTWPRTGAPGVQAAGVLLLALVARLALFPHPVDSDVYRYLWEGRLVREGYDPYARVASAPEWAGLHDAYWQGMNQKGLRTIYPPVAEWIFSAAGGVWYHPLALKAMFVAFDLGSIVLLLAMLSSRSQPFVHALAGVLWKGFFRATHGLEGDARIVRRAHGVSLPAEAKDPVTSPATAARDHCFGEFHLY